MAERNTPRLMDAAGECLLYDELQNKSLKIGGAARQIASSYTLRERRIPLVYTIVIVLIVLFVIGYLR